MAIATMIGATPKQIDQAQAKAQDLCRLAYAPQPVAQPDGSTLALCWSGRIARAYDKLAIARIAADGAAIRKIETALAQLQATATAAFEAAETAKCAWVAMATSAGQSANIDEVWEMSRKWAEMMDTEDDQSLHEELSALEETFRHFEALNMQGGLIRANGRVIAFSIGDPLNEDVYLVQFEKAYPDIPGAYQVINQQFAEHYAARYKFANREDDAGDEGLRKAKLSYDPIFLVAKYSARQITQ